MRKTTSALLTALVVVVPHIADAEQVDPAASTAEQRPIYSGRQVSSSVPPNDWCDGAIEVFAGETLFDASGATNDGPPLDYVCMICDPGPCPLPRDVWFTYNAPDTGRVDIEIPEAQWLEAVHVYEGCACPAQIERLLECGSSGRVTFTAWKGTCYLIQVDDPASPGTITVTPSFPDPCPNREAKFLYVDDDAPPGGDGSSWDDAIDDLQQAISLASQAGSEVTEIRVAAGTYKPDTGVPGDRSATFLVPTCVTMRGGYAGHGAGDPDAWNPEKYESTLSGDLNGNDEPDYVNRTDNAFHVVTVQDTDENTLLEGFTITAGYADTYPDRSGAGLLCVNSRATVRRCVFEDNQATHEGGAIFGCDGLIERCTIRNNDAWFGGGVAGCNGRIENSHIVSNTATHGAGLSASDATISNSVVSDNVASGNGGGFSACHGQIHGCLISGNSAISGAGLFRCDGAVLSSRIFGNRATLFGGGLALCGGPVAGCVIAGNSAQVNGGGLYDCTGPVTNCSIIGNRTTIDGAGGGAIADCTGGFTNCIIWNNSIPWSSYSYPSPTYSCTQGSSPRPGGITSDPRIVDPGRFDESGTWIEGDYRLLSDSPCIDAGDNDAVVDAGLTHDLDGFVRLYDAPQAPDVGNGVGPIVDMGAYEYGDCNRNLIPDTEDVISGGSGDCNANQIPDECIYLEDDCNDNDTPDACDVASGTPDCTGNGVPDECEPDCNDNGQADSCDLLDGIASDCNHDQIPDSCNIDTGFSRDDLPPEGDGIPDECQEDCDANGLPDDMDLDLGGDVDCDANGVLDVCELEPALGRPRPLDTTAASDRGDDRGIDLATDGHGNWVGVWSSTDEVVYRPGQQYALHLSRSHDDGATWSDPVPLWPSGDGSAAVGPNVISLGPSVFLAAWIVSEVPYGSNPANQLTVARSDDAGAAWSEPRIVGASLEERKWSLSLDGDDRGVLVLAWSTGPGGGERSWYSRSNDGGATWREPVEFVENGREREPVVASAGDGTWICVRYRFVSHFGSDYWDVVLSRSEDNGLTWTTDVLPGASGPGTQGDPFIATDGRGNWVTVWTSDVLPNGTESDVEILSAYSKDNGITWSFPSIVNSDAASDTLPDREPEVWTDGNGYWIVVWQREGSMYFAASATNGASWSETQLLAAGGVYEADFAGNGQGTWIGTWSSTDDLGGLVGPDRDIVFASLGRQGDCNGNARLDACDLLLDESADCNHNDIPDECELQADCNDNGVQDICDAAQPGTQDCTGNGVPDECERDCNLNGVADSCDIQLGATEDCNGDGVPDICDVATGRSFDQWPLGGDGIPDECQGMFRFPHPRWPTLQATIYAAPDEATVVVSQGVYRGSGNRDLKIADKSLHLKCDGPPGSCVIDCERGGRGFDIRSTAGANTVIDGFTVINGLADEEGGGMRIDDASPLITNCRFENNTAGGYHSGSGAGIYVSGDSAVPTFHRCIFANNHAVDGSGGGLITWGEGLIISECLFTGNMAYRGAGVSLFGTTAFITNSRFIGNSASPTNGSGGGLAGFGADLVLHNSLFSHNTAHDAHAIYLPDGSGQIRGSTFISNRPEESTNRWAIELGSVEIVDSILWDNGERPLQTSGTVSYSLLEYFQAGTGNVFGDPGFVTDVPGEYRLGPKSPCINAGDPDYVGRSGLADIDGHSRVLCGRVDMGASEFGIGDYDCDRAVDLIDFAGWMACLTEPYGGPLIPGCSALDFDGDSDVDITDYAGFQNVFGGG